VPLLFAPLLLGHLFAIGLNAAFGHGASLRTGSDA
jgi:hypothetical protein